VFHSTQKYPKQAENQRLITDIPSKAVPRRLLVSGPRSWYQ